MDQDHILLLEDDASLRRNLAMFLENAGYHVTQAPDGESALALLQSTAEQPCPYTVVVSDIVMGSVDGIQVMEAARRLPQPPEVILLTGHGSLETAMAAIRTGAFDYLLKPCRIARLLERVAAAVAHHNTQRRATIDAMRGRKFTEFAGEILAGDEPPDSLPATGQQAATPPATQQHYLEVGPLHIDTRRHTVWFRQKRVELTTTEYAILVCLALHDGGVCSFGDITRYTHGHALQRSDAQQLLGTHIRNLRKKLEHGCILSVRGVGYMLVNPDEDESG